MAKQFFLEHDIDFRDIDVSTDLQAADEMIKKSGQMGVPVVIVKKHGVEEIVVGFQKEKLSRLLGVS